MFAPNTNHFTGKKSKGKSKKRKSKKKTKRVHKNKYPKEKK